MRNPASSNRLSATGGPAFHSRLSALVLAMFATMATIYVAVLFLLQFFFVGLCEKFYFEAFSFLGSKCKVWQEAETRVYIIQELDRKTGQGHSAISVDDTLKIITCREQQKKLSALEMDLATARQEGFVSKNHLGNDGTHSKKRLLADIGIITTFGRKKNRDAIRKAWMQSGNASFLLKSRDAEFYVKVNDDVYVNIDALGATLSTHLDKPRVYMGCMKSGEVLSKPTHKWYEPDWWKFGDAKSYFRHASGEIYAISRTLAQFISINRSILRIYAHDDVSAGSWFIGLDVKHVDERKFCCSSWSTGLYSFLFQTHEKMRACLPLHASTVHTCILFCKNRIVKSSHTSFKYGIWLLR
ncbi:hypothetical protein PTKIN_Ptkin04bG0185700 [Pterospermum kingtungense]